MRLLLLFCFFLYTNALTMNAINTMPKIFATLYNHTLNTALALHVCTKLESTLLTELRLEHLQDLYEIQQSVLVRSGIIEKKIANVFQASHGQRIGSLWTYFTLLHSMLDEPSPSKYNMKDITQLREYCIKIADQFCQTFDNVWKLPQWPMHKAMLDLIQKMEEMPNHSMAMDEAKVQKVACPYQLRDVLNCEQTEYVQQLYKLQQR